MNRERLADRSESALFNDVDELISIKDIQNLFGLSKSSAQRLVHSPDFPKSYALNSRVLRWDRVEVEAWFLTKREKPQIKALTNRSIGNQIVIDGVAIRRVSK